MKTRSGQPLADEMSRAIERSLDAQGFDAAALLAGSGRARVRGPRAGPERVLVLSLAEWKSDTMIATWLRYDVSLRVLDPQGAELAVLTRKESQELGGSPDEPIVLAERVVPLACRRALESLLEDPTVAAALR